MEAITGTLGLNWQGLLWHTINFIVLLVLLLFGGGGYFYRGRRY